jgi:hypothetical protein
MKQIRNIFLLITLLLIGQIDAKDALQYYEAGYKLEKNTPIYSIPLYEKVLSTNADSKLKRITGTRLYYLYKRYKKYPELLSLYSRYGSLLSLGKEHNNNIQDLLKYYKISIVQFQKIYPLIQIPDPENTSTILEILMAESSKHLFEFTYSFMIHRRQYEELRILTFYLPSSIASNTLRIGILVKTQDDLSSDVITEYLEKEDITNAERSDILYLYGILLRKLNHIEEAIEYFNRSKTYGNPERGKREIAKTMVSQFRITEACKMGKFTPREFNEADYLLTILCTASEKPIPELRQALNILSEREENDRYYLSASKWLWGN